MGKRVLIAVAGAAIAAAFSAPVAGAASNTFSFTAKDAKLAVANLQPITLDPAQVPVAGLPKLDPISIKGTMSDSGAISAPRDGVKFPSLQVPVPQELIDQLAGLAGSAGSLPNIGGFDIGALLKNGSLAVTISAGLVPAGPVTGSFSRDSGALAMKVPLDVSIGIKATVFKLIPLELIKCSLTGINFDVTSAGATMPMGTALAGAAYSPSAKTATVAGVATVPAPTCTGLAASFLGSALDRLGTSLGQVGLGISGDVVVPPPAVATLTAAKTVKISSSGKVTAKVTCSKARSCKGTVAIAQPGGAVMVSKAFTVAAGKSQTVSITMPKSAKTLMKTVPKMDAVFRVSVNAGSAFSKPVSLQRPLNWR